MKQSKDRWISGEKYFKITAVSRVEDSESGRQRYLCRCDCGREVVLLRSNLGRTKSCGCLINASKKRDLSGRRVGKLTVICEAEVENRKGNCVTWRCLCDCGNMTYIRSNALTASKRSRRTQSCGCLIGEVAKKRTKDLTGQRFGRLLALRRMTEEEAGPRYVKYECECDCGRMFAASQHRLSRGKTKSCGCLVRESLSPGYHHGPILPDQGGLWNKVFRSTRRSADVRGLEWSIDNEFVKSLVSMPCTYCGAEWSREIRRVSDSIKINGIDRKDPSIGYTKENCVPCCTTCNRAKQGMLPDQFIRWARSVVDNFERDA